MEVCAYCGGKLGKRATREHILPKSICTLGWIEPSDPRNIVKVHKSCNQAKGSSIYIPYNNVMDKDLHVAESVKLCYGEFLYENVDTIILVLLDMDYLAMRPSGAWSAYPWCNTNDWNVHEWIKALEEFKEVYPTKNDAVEVLLCKAKL